MGYVRYTRKNFRSSTPRFGKKITGLTVDVLPAVAAMAFQSIVHGSSLTGAPGQPEADGDLLRSWRQEQLSPARIAIITNSPYARPNEDGVRKFGKPYVQRSAGGGRHSVRITRNGLPRLVRAAVKNSLLKEPA